MATTPLFNPSQMPDGEKISHIMRLIDVKAKGCFLTLGIIKIPNGKLDFNLYGTLRTVKDQNSTISVPAENFGDMLSQLVEILENLDK